jgi:hypothetical protein
MSVSSYDQKTQALEEGRETIDINYNNKMSANVLRRRPDLQGMFYMCYLCVLSFIRVEILTFKCDI